MTLTEFLPIIDISIACAALWISIRGKAIKRIGCYCMRCDTTLFPYRLEREEFDLVYESIEDVARMHYFSVTNTGNKPVQISEFTRPITFSFKNCKYSRLLPIICSDEDIKASISEQEGIMTLHFSYLNPGDYIEGGFFLNREAEVQMNDGRILGGKCKSILEGLTYRILWEMFILGIVGGIIGKWIGILLASKIEDVSNDSGFIAMCVAVGAFGLIDLVMAIDSLKGRKIRKRQPFYFLRFNIRQFVKSFTTAELKLLDIDPEEGYFEASDADTESNNVVKQMISQGQKRVKNKKNGNKRNRSNHNKCEERERTKKK